MAGIHYRALTTSTGTTGTPQDRVHAGDTRPLKIVLVVDFKGFIHLKKQAQQRAK
jgi:hypothetical protein